MVHNNPPGAAAGPLVPDSIKIYQGAFGVLEIMLELEDERTGSSLSEPQ